ncbi:MAG: hypothetical protein JWP08_4561, partial [Bryobacterales bacterium]|nr:hypothetical protein [Bryobacterales bacterium]
MDVQDSSSQAPTDALSDDFFAAPAPAAESYALAPAAPVAPLEPAWS